MFFSHRVPVQLRRVALLVSPTSCGDQGMCLLQHLGLSLPALGTRSKEAGRGLQASRRAGVWQGVGWGGAAGSACREQRELREGSRTVAGVLASGQSLGLTGTSDVCSPKCLQGSPQEQGSPSLPLCPQAQCECPMNNCWCNKQTNDKNPDHRFVDQVTIKLVIKLFMKSSYAYSDCESVLVECVP